MNIKATISSEQGKREYQEDRALFRTNILSRYTVAGVFDGHVGSAASEYVKKNVIRVLESELDSNNQVQRALYNTIKKLEYGYSGPGYTKAKLETKAYTDKLVKLPEIAGTTVVLIVIDNKTHKLYVANVGDSRAILVRNKHVFQITPDHNLDSIGPKTLSQFNKDGSAYIQEGYLWTTTDGSDDGKYGLNVVRTLGDPLFKARFNPHILKSSSRSYDIISWVPDLLCHKIQDGDTIILESDGITNFMSNTLTAQVALKGGASAVTKKALANKSSDNVTAVVISVH